MEINCPRCKEEIPLQTERDCHEQNDCNCEDGIITIYWCEKCTVEVQITMDCKGYQDDKEDY